MENIRNFSIIAHVDHGKSTLADRMLEFTGALTSREMKDQVLDKMDLERERGITIKAQAVRLKYKAKNGQEYMLNLIDTPGHVDFSYEVSRSLGACEGGILLVDASQGIEAQTIANFHLASDLGLEVIPVINKIDLPAADPVMAKQQIEDILCIDASEAVLASAKKGVGVEDVLEAVVNKIPPPKGDRNAPLKALLLDSWYDPYKGVVVLTRIYDGVIRPNMKIWLMRSDKEYVITQLGVSTPADLDLKEAGPGEVVFFTAAIKTVADTNVGDTITEYRRPTTEPLAGFKESKPMVFSGLYPVEGDSYEALREALEKLHLNDASFQYEPETSAALGFGFRCGFLGLLHMEIIRERLERDFDLTLISTSPSVNYRVTLQDGTTVMVDNPSRLPKMYNFIEEPIMKATIISPDSYIGDIYKLVEEKRGVQEKMEYIGSGRVMLVYHVPLNEVVLDFFDKLKSATRGYASVDFEDAGFQKGKLVKLDLMVNGEAVDALSFIVHSDKAYTVGRDLAARMKELIPRQMFEIAIQASIGSRVIARESIKAMRKNVTAKCYGGDISRKRKLLEKQKAGKKKMKQIGNVEIPQNAFMAILKK
ncbi:MAG: translation elongation factor 4 [Nitrospinota bacterium]|nr:translation elongation factor 4 [Nitrospinota bacterium]